jgi:hypothetical protein
MKPWLVCVSASILALVNGCASQPSFPDPFTRPQIDWTPSLVLDIDEAQRILGGPGRLEKVTTYLDEGTKTYVSAFKDDALDPRTGKAGILYYMYEEYESSDTVRSYLYSTLKENHVDPADGIRMEGGAELHYLTGSPVVRMAMILKGNRLIRLKVNVVTSHYGLAEFQEVATGMAEKL